MLIWTLSACNSGNGKLLGEEGIASLERAFLLAVERSVLARLMNVSTSTL
jgi:hypothetical protein